MSKPKPLTICKMTQSLMMKSHPITFTISPIGNKPFPVKRYSFHVNSNKTFNMIRCRITLNNKNTCISIIGANKSLTLLSEVRLRSKKLQCKEEKPSLS